MANDELKRLLAQGIAAMHAGARASEGATQEVQDDATHPDLKRLLEEGTRQSAQWKGRIERAAQESGPADDQGNPIVEAHVEVARRIRRQAPDDSSRDLGIIAAGQLALHYWIAAFGTAGAYAQRLGMGATAEAFGDCVREARAADERHTELAQSMLR